MKIKWLYDSRLTTEKVLSSIIFYHGKNNQVCFSLSWILIIKINVTYILTSLSLYKRTIQEF